MFSKKTKLKLTDFECNLLWGEINEMRNKACSDGIPTEDVARANIIYPKLPQPTEK